ncbi:MAG: hypothetical protein AB7G07_16260 [Bauldia sp.]
MTLVTSGLTPGHVVTVWWVVFNSPEDCTHGEAGLRCGEGDLLVAEGAPEVEGTVLYAAGAIIGPDGSGHFSAYLPTGDTSHVTFGLGPGLTRPWGADIHAVVRDHGPAQAGLLGQQIGTFGGGCLDAPEGAGTAGNFECVDLQFAAHEQSLVVAAR